MPDPREMRDGHYTPLENARLIPREQAGQSRERHADDPPHTVLGGQQAGELTGADPADDPPDQPDARGDRD